MVRSDMAYGLMQNASKIPHTVAAVKSKCDVKYESGIITQMKSILLN